MKVFDELFGRYPQLKGCEGEIAKAFDLLLTSYRNGGKVLVCGNGGSASDAEHIVGELLKKFKKHRDISPGIAAKLPPELVAKLEGALPAVSLVSMSGILTAFANDVAWETAFAQQVYGLGNPGDVLIALSTSGNSANCVNAALVAKAKGVAVVSMTGAGGGRLGELADAAIKVSEMETYKIQELHLPVYHALCAALEEMLF
ncbi:MAG: SIS domain-containing protein [bacterium]|nr:SIS domain-containing protein [Candidatus Colisoma equi]